MYMSELAAQVVSDFDSPVAQTLYGKVRGIQKEGVYVFRGIPYGKARRFHMAEKPDPWTGVKDALVYGPEAPKIMAMIPSDQQLNPHYYAPQDENCQNLNVWTPTMERGAKKPVMFWLHGGGFEGGAALEQYAGEGENMARVGDIVFVSANFRLNCLGCLDLSSLDEEYENSTFCGISDLVMALQWIHDNIENFGGDKENVTLFSQAGGATQAMTIMQTPAADGLYHKLTVEGWLIHHLRYPKKYTKKQVMQRMGEMVAESLGLTKDTIREIETIPYWFLADAVKKSREKMLRETGIRFCFEPVADEKYTYSYTMETGLRKETMHVPVLAGGDIADSRSNQRLIIGDNKKDEWDDETKMNYLREMYGDVAEEVLEAFRHAYPDDNTCGALYLDRKGRQQILKLAKQRAAEGGKVWTWIFKTRFPINGNLIPYHCCVNPFITHNADYCEGSFIEGVSDDLQDRMTSAWAAFARYGDPNCSCLPQWPAVEAGKVPTMIFDKECVCRINHDERLQKLLEPWYIGEYFIGNPPQLNQISYDMKEILANIDNVNYV